MADPSVSPLTGPPDYSGPILSDVVPAAALSLGAGDIFDDTARARAQALGLDRDSRTTIVVLIDGMGESQLKQYSGYTPFFRSLAASRRTLSTGFPSTTANSLSSLATGRLPGGHGVVGYRVLDPAKDAVLADGADEDLAIDADEGEPSADDEVDLGGDDDLGVETGGEDDEQ